MHTNFNAFSMTLDGISATHEFEALSHHTVVGSQFTGVEFAGSAVIYSEGAFPSGGAPNSGTNVLLNETVFAPFAFSFFQSADGVGFFNTSLQDRQLLTLFADDNSIIYTGELPEGSVNFLGVVSDDVEIARGEVIGIVPQTFGTIFVDDFTLGNVTAVPDPCRLAFGCTSVAGFVGDPR